MTIRMGRKRMRSIPFPISFVSRTATLLLQHVGMNIKDRRTLYGEMARVLAPGGRFVTYDLIPQ